MASDPSGERFDELVSQVIAPVVLGGRVQPVRPFGPALALRVGVERAITDGELRSRLDVARVRRARLIAPVDTVDDLDASDFALAAGLNDLLQVTNHELGGRFTRGRYGLLLAGVAELCRSVPGPRTIAAALSRHATFARVMELSRTDTTVSWWTGKASFRGQAPPSRLLLWRGLRRVTVDERRVSFIDMCQGFDGAQEEGFCDALGVWLTRSPLTDLATVTRRSPPFVWSEPSLSLVATVPGRTLAWRLLARQGVAVSAALARATKQIPEGAAEARAIAEGFVAEGAQGFQAMEEQRGRSQAGRAG